MWPRHPRRPGRHTLPDELRSKIPPLALWPPGGKNLWRAVRKGILLVEAPLAGPQDSERLGRGIANEDPMAARIADMFVPQAPFALVQSGLGVAEDGEEHFVGVVLLSHCC